MDTDYLRVFLKSHGCPVHPSPVLQCTEVVPFHYGSALPKEPPLEAVIKACF